MNEVKVPLAPIIPREVADAIERVRANGGLSNERIVSYVTNTKFNGASIQTLRTIPFNTLLAALVNGYSAVTNRERVATAIAGFMSDGVTALSDVLDEIDRIYNEGVGANE